MNRFGKIAHSYIRLPGDAGLSSSDGVSGEKNRHTHQRRRIISEKRPQQTPGNVYVHIPRHPRDDQRIDRRIRRRSAGVLMKGRSKSLPDRERMRDVPGLVQKRHRSQRPMGSGALLFPRVPEPHSQRDQNNQARRSQQVLESIAEPPGFIAGHGGLLVQSRLSIVQAGRIPQRRGGTK